MKLGLIENRLVDWIVSLLVVVLIPVAVVWVSFGPWLTNLALRVFDLPGEALTDAAWAGPLILLGVWEIVILLVALFTLKNHDLRGAIYLMLFVLAIGGGGWQIFRQMRDGVPLARIIIPSTPDHAILEAAAAACQGQPVPGAAAYSGDSSIHPLVLLGESGQVTALTGPLPPDWAPESVSDLELVACLTGEEKVLIQRCSYFGGSVPRWGYERVLTLVEAQTGEVLRTAVIRGTPPRDCRSSEVKNTELVGRRSRFGDGRKWLATFVGDVSGWAFIQHNTYEMETALASAGLGFETTVHSSEQFSWNGVIDGISLEIPHCDNCYIQIWSYADRRSQKVKVKSVEKNNRGNLPPFYVLDNLYISATRTIPDEMLAQIEAAVTSLEGAE